MLKPEDFYLLRAPYLPISCAEEMLNNPAGTIDMLNDLCNRPDIKQAIFLASPVLYNEMEKMSSGLADKDKLARIQHSLLKYLIRASCRSTPYGIFSGTSMGMVADKTEITLSDNDQHLLFVRLDMDLLEIIVQKIAAIPSVKKNLKYYPNNSCYVINDKLNYLESQMLKRTKTFNLSRIDFSEYVENALALSRDGIRQDQLCKYLKYEEFTTSEIAVFVHELIDNQILIHNLTPSLTGPDALESIIDKISDLAKESNDVQISDLVKTLHRIQLILNSKLSIQEKQSAVLDEIVLSFNITDYHGDFFQVDLKIQTTSNQLSKKVVEQITNQITDVAMCMPNIGVQDLDVFKDKYINRYENQELPLTQVLDDEAGIGYGNSGNHLIGSAALINELTNYTSKTTPSFELDFYQTLIQNKFHEAVRQNLYEVEISEENINNLKQSNSKKTRLPDSMYIMGTLVAGNNQEIDNGNYQFKLDYFNGPSAATILARFCHTDAELFHNIKNTLKKEELVNENAIYAEIVHSPQPRLGNVIHRPVLREFEIPYLCESGGAKDKLISIEDLYVSIDDGQVILRSKKLNRRIIPCLSTAQNFRFASLPLYKFLCDLQFQGIMSSFKWDWRNFSTAAFLPRVVYKKVILSPATWNIRLKDPALDLTNKNQSDLSSLLKNFFSEYKVPEKVLLLDGDNRLLIDFRNELSYDIFYRHLLKYQYAVLSESFLNSDNCFIKDTLNQKFVNEIVIPVTRQPSPNQNTTVPDFPQPAKVQRKFILGSEWLYFKIYGGLITLDKIIKEKISFLIEELERGKIIDKWFYIRYADPDNHIRLRFHLTTNDQWYEVIRLFNEILAEEIENNSLYKIQYDTYERELERYGEDMIDYCEQLFWLDSSYTLKILSEIEEEQDNNLIWLIALQSVDQYLNAFGLSLKEKITFSERMAKSFYREFGDPKDINKELNALYKKHRNLIEEALHPQQAHPGFQLQHAIGLLNERTVCLAESIKGIINIYSSKGIREPDISLLPSVIHMSVNRLFSSYQRKYEMITYHFLEIHYKKMLWTTPNFELIHQER